MNQRSIYLDNLKGTLITLVVVGHMTGPLVHQSIIFKSAYFYIYLFHVPAFAFLSGYLSSHKKWYAISICKLGLVFICFELSFRIFYLIMLGKPLLADPLTPTWIVWFVCSLGTWRMVLPLFQPLSFWLIFITFLVALGCGAVQWIGYPLSLSRTIYFFPFFLAGNLFRQRDMSFSTILEEKFAVLIMSFMTIPAYYLATSIDLQWLYGSCSYPILGCAITRGMIIRAGLFVFATVMGLSMLSLVSERKGFLTMLGRHGLVIYLAHGFVIRSVAIYLGLYP